MDTAEQIVCPNCGGENLTMVEAYEIDDDGYEREIGGILQCDACGTAFGDVYKD